MRNIREATVADAIAVAPRLREADRQECLALTGMEPELILPLTTEQSTHTWALTNDEGEAEGIMGLSPVDQHPYFGIVWLCSTPYIFKKKRLFLEQSRQGLEMLHDIYPLLGNHIDARNTAHIRWLKWLGFSFLRLIPEFGVEKRPFYEFARLRSPSCA